MGSDDYSDGSPDNNVPDPADRTWRHPSEMAAQARVVSPSPFSRSTTRSARLPGPVWLLAAGVVVGIAMVGFIQRANTSEAAGSQTEVPQPEPPPATAAIDLPPTTTEAELPDETFVSSVQTTYLSPVLQTRVARPEGVLTVYADDGETILGSALAIESMILTSASSLAGHRTVLVSSAGGSMAMMEATLLGTDSFSDLAVLLVANSTEPLNLPTSPLGEAAPKGRVIVIAGGSTFLTDAASGKVLRLNIKAKSAAGYELDGIASTSVEVSEKDAGGGLFDGNGSVLGLVVKTNEHLASVLPIEDAISLAHSLVESGRIAPNWAGIYGSSIPTGGLVVNSVSADSPAELAGLQSGDSILAVNGRPISSMADFVHYVRALESGSTIQVRVERNGEIIEMSVQLGWRG